MLKRGDRSPPQACTVALLLLALACRGCTAQTQAQIESGIAAAFNQDIIINADMFTDRPEMLSGGLGFTSIIGVSDPTNETVVRQAGGAWNSGLTCSDPAYTPPTRVITSASQTTMWLQGFNCTANLYDGLPICFSWPILPSSISKDSFSITLSDGSKVVPQCIGISPNWEFNERQCVVAFGKFGNRINSKRGGVFATKTEVVRGASLKLVGPKGPVSAAGLYFKNKASPYDGPNTGPVFIAVRMSVLTNLGEGISVPVIATQTAFPNDGIAIFGAYDGSLGPAGQRYRIRLFYSGGMTPDGVRSMRPTLFSDFFYLLGRAEHKDRRRRTRRYTVKLTRTGVVYDLGKDVGSVKILGLADTGKPADPANGVNYDDCYQEDYDNYLDIILDASSERAARAVTTLKAYYTREGYASVYNPGGPGTAPTPGVRYSTPAPAQTWEIEHALRNPRTVTWCNYNGVFTRDPQACTALVSQPI